MKLDFNALELFSKKPELYEKGNSVIWTDEHISEQLLQIHLNSKVDLASRTKQSIDQTIDFILQFCNKRGCVFLIWAVDRDYMQKNWQKRGIK